MEAKTHSRASTRQGGNDETAEDGNHVRNVSRLIDVLQRHAATGILETLTIDASTLQNVPEEYWETIEVPLIDKTKHRRLHHFLNDHGKWTVVTFPPQQYVTASVAYSHGAYRS